MSGGSSRAKTPRSEGESYLVLVANLGGILALLVALVVLVRTGERPRPQSVAAVLAPAPPKAVEPPPAAPAPRPRPAPRKLEPDAAAIARARAALDAASRDRARAEARAANAARQLTEVSTLVAFSTASSRNLALRVRDPSAQLARVSARGGFVRADRDRLKDELIALSQAPRPKARSLVDKSPVARPAGGEEYHFEVRRNRVSYIDLNRLLDLVKADAQLRIRMSDPSRGVESKVGPIGAFSLEYVMARALPNGIEELMERRGISYDLRGWEVVPEFDGRGETYDQACRPVSEFARAIGRLNPSNATITMWIYPNGFSLFRRLRDDLHARGFLVAARPLPEGLPIRGSPGGSLSAGQ